MKKLVLILMVLMLCMPSNLADACFCVAIGKNASPTGYAMVIHNEDDSQTDVVMHYWVPARDDWLTNSDPSDDVLPADTGRAQNIPQLAKTNGFYYGEVKGAFGVGANSACGMLNEYGVSVMSNQCGSTVSAAMATIKDGGIWFNLRRCVAERGTSARNAVEIVVNLLNDWGYADSGRTYTIGDYKEVWLVHVSRGQQYVATRVPDDHVAVMPNHYTVDLLNEYAPTGPFGAANADSLYRPDIFSFVRTNFPARLPAASADLELNFRNTFRSGALSTGNTYRQAIAEYNYIGIPLSSDMASAAWHNARTFKFSNKMNGQATIQQIFKTHTSHYEGTSWDVNRPFNLNPHSGAGQRVCATATIESKIIQFHEDLKLTTLWTAFGHPCTLPYIPLHPLAYGADIEKLVPDAVQYPASEAAYRLANHFPNLGDHKQFRNNKQDNIRRFQYMMDMVYGQHYDAFFANNANYLYTMFDANNALLATNPTVEELASFDRAASDKALAMQREYLDSDPLLDIPVYSTAKYIDRSNTAQTQIDLIFELPEDKIPSATNLRLVLGSVTSPNAANIVSGSLQALGGGKWKCSMTKANLTGSSGVGASGKDGLYQFVFGGQTTDASPRYFTGMVVLNFSTGPTDFELVASSLTPFASVILDSTYTPPAAQTVTITNVGKSSVLLDQPTSMYFDLTAVPATTLLSSGFVTFDVRPKSGLPVGTYNETIVVTGTNASVEVDASFTVVPAGYTISAAPVDIVFPTAQAPSYTQPTAQIVTITNNGTGAVTLNQPTATSFDIGTLSTTNVAAGATATFTVQPKAGLAQGIYVNTINITGNNGASCSVVAFFTVSPKYDIEATPLTQFDSVLLDGTYTPPAEQTVLVTNVGTSSIMLSQPTSAYFDITSLSATTLLPGDSATFGVRPKSDLAVGTYSETIKINGTNVSVEVDASFTVLPAEYTISVVPIDLVFPSGQAKTYTPPEGKTVTITNNGTGTITLVQPTAVSFDIGSLSSTVIAADETATFTVQPKADMQAGLHVEAINITGSNSASSSVVAFFIVTPKSGGGGCNAGFGLVALLMATPFIVRRRK